MSDLDLSTRTGLPDALRDLVRQFPRGSWERHPEFAGLVSFWMERHQMFRQLTETLRGDTMSAMDGKLEDAAHRTRLSRFGAMLISNLHQHHQIEDVHYFPQLVDMEPPLQRGFDILDKDHHAMDGLLNRLTEAANGVITKQGEPGRFLDEIAQFKQMLLRHLEDEEDLVVPVILKHGASGLQ